MKTHGFLSLLVIPMALAQARAAYPLPAAPPGITGKGGAQVAVEKFRAGSLATALDLARPLAEDGDVDALFLLAYAMESKEPAKLSRGQAMDLYYRKAAGDGHPEAGLRRNLILMVSGSEKERNDGRQALELAAQKDPRACRILGEAWLRGFVTGKPDPAKASEHWKASGDKGDGESLILLAKLHEGTFGFPELLDEKIALGFYQKAAHLGNAAALVPLGSLLLNSGENEEIRKEGRDWLEKAIEKKDRSAWLVLGNYEKTRATNDKAAMEFYMKGAEAGDMGCMMRVAALTPTDAERRAWLRRASEAGSPMASAELGRLILKDTKPDFIAARRYLTSAARDGISQAQYDLGMLYLEGQDGVLDPVSARGWLTEAIKEGNPEVQYQLGVLHEHGIGGPVNYANAGVLYTLACNKGHAAAATRISGMALDGLGTPRDAAQAKAHAVLGLERGDTAAKRILTELDGKLDAEQVAKADQALARLRTAAKALGNKGAGER